MIENSIVGPLMMNLPALAFSRIIHGILGSGRDVKDV